MQIYYHGDPIDIKVKINNGTSKVVKKIKVTGELIRQSEKTRQHFGFSLVVPYSQMTFSLFSHSQWSS